MTHVSLFAGIGGLDLAAEWAGFETVLQVERDAYCLKVLQKHWPDVPRITDIREVTSESVNGDVTVVSGGFPCQPHSLVGSRQGANDDRFLWPEMRRIVAEVLPTWVVAENVPGAVSDGTYDIAASDLEDIGYEVAPFVEVAAASFGAPHIRYRSFIVANAKGVGCRQGYTNKRKGGQRKIAPKERARFTDSDRWSTKPDVLRVAYGIPNRAHRLRALGNAVVPQQAYPIFAAIAEVENAS